MKAIGWLALAGLVLLLLFAVANWSLLTAPATLNLLVLTVEGPLGLILLGATFVLAALFAVYALSLRASALVETRRHLKELQAQRELADRAEASRFTTLSTKLEQEVAGLRAHLDQSHAALLQRTDALETSLRQSLNETANELVANLGQLDDKVDRMQAPAASRIGP